MRGREKKREKSWFSYLRTLIQRRSFGVPFYLNGSSFIPALECATATSSKINTTSLPRRSIFLVCHFFLKRRIINPNLEIWILCFFWPFGQNMPAPTNGCVLKKCQGRKGCLCKGAAHVRLRGIPAIRFVSPSTPSPPPLSLSPSNSFIYFL